MSSRAVVRVVLAGALTGAAGWLREPELTQASFEHCRPEPQGVPSANF
jgi:hypothetical protein